MTYITNGNVFKALESWAPQHLAYDWDNVGLQIGSYSERTKKVLVTLDVLEPVADEAIDAGVNLIIAHHPLIFKPLKRIDFQTPKGGTIKKLIENNITVYAAHTNLDIAQGGVNDLLADKLGLDDVQPLVDMREEPLLKLMVFVPKTHAEQVRDALGKAGAGHIGNYSHCTFQTEGHGTFMPLEGTDPFIGSTNKLEIVDEFKMETVVKEKDLHRVITAMKKAHPYEEVAYDLFPLKHIGPPFGLGRIGTMKETADVKALSETIKNVFDIENLRVTGDLTQQIKKVAVIGGSGEKYLYQAKKMGADAFITGDVTFHLAQDAKELGLALIDPGHYIETIMKRATKQYLLEKFSGMEVFESKVNTDPFQFV